MDSNGVSRAPLTRSRRRISPEQVEEVKTAVTPTKKRGKAAAKPQLDDIDENTPINSPKKLRRSSVKISNDVVKSETPTSVLTPAKRSSRIISNTSITSESTQNCDSPRALRASRRLSRTGSDADTPTLTPTKTLRRTRRSVTHNESSGESTNPVSQQLINEVIPEETDQLNTSTKVQTQEKVRKSPRLSKKSNSANNTPEKDESAKQNNDDDISGKTETQISVETTDKTVKESVKPQINKDLNNTVPCYNSNKRYRTDSLNINGKTEDISTPSFFSDNEGGKVKKIKKSKKKLIANEKENNQDQVDGCFISNSLRIHDDGLVSMSRISKNAPVIEHIKDDLHPKSDFIEDSNSCSPDKATNLMNQESGDQCVPEVKPLTGDKEILEQKLSTTLSANIEPIGFMIKRDRTATDLSYEPMDIDETIPENVTVQDFSNESIESPNKSKSTHNQEKKNSDSSQNVAKKNSSVPNEHELSKSISKSSLNESEVAKTSMQAKEKEKDLSDTEIESSKLNKSKNKSHHEKDVPEIVLNTSSNRDTTTLDVSQFDVKTNKIHDKADRKSLNTPIKISTQTFLCMQTSTPVDTQSKLSKNKINNSVNSDDSDNNIQPKNVKKSKKTQLLESDDSSDESDDTNKLVIEEAQEASDDYESGDSMDDKERQHMEENEIIEKGESIGSDTTDYSSDPSDYDKDSFLVSSSEEDNELLSGSGDDLSMSDNQLSMSKKSKAKFDQRKLKEQKRASREMFEARHGLKKKNNDSDSSLISKKNKNLSNSSQDQEDEQISVITGIRHNRMRIESEVTETEISAIVNESIMNKQDPLQKAIKVEPKTPHNSFNISSANIQPNVEHLEIDENATLMKSNTTHDPLENMSEDDDSSQCSENEEIKENYDSLLSNLNKDKKNIPKIQVNDKNVEGSKISDSETSDSIDLKLLFSENDGDSDSSNGKRHNKKEVLSSDENFIPLKRVEGKTNLRESEDASSGSVAENKVSKKNKKLSETMPIQSEKDEKTWLKKKKDKMLSQSLTTQAEHVSNQFLCAKKKKTSESSTTNQPESETSQSLHFKKRKTTSESSMTNQSLSPKKKKASECMTNQSENDDSEKKKSSSEASTTIQSTTETNQSLSPKKKKKSSNQTEHNTNSSLNSKKIKTSSDSSMTLAEDINQTLNLSKSFNSKQNRSILGTSLTNQTEHEANQSFESKKKKTSESSSITEQNDSNQLVKSKKIKTSSANILSECETKQSLYLDKKEQNIKKTQLRQLSDNSKGTTMNEYNKGNRSSNQPEQSSNQPAQKINPGSNIGKLNPGKGQKRKMSDSLVESSVTGRTELGHKPMNSKKIKKKAQSDVSEENTNYSAINIRKRKQRPEGDNGKNKILCGFLDKLPVPRLPTTVLDQLDEKAKTNVLSTTKFNVENTTKRKNKPSEYLEDSIYLNSQSPEKKRRRKLNRKPKVLPFIPTACTSGSGFTTSFQISIVPKVVEFVAQSSTANNFKMDKMKHTKHSASKYKPQKKSADMKKY